MKKSIVIGLHIGFWLCYLVLTIVLLYLSLEGEENSVVDKATVRVIYFAIIPSVISYYTFYFLVFPAIRRKRFTLSVVYAFVISVGASLIGTALIYIFLGIESLTGAQESVGVGITFISFVSLIIGIMALVTKGFITWYGELKLKEELQQKNHEMEMALVKSQLDPHFLFNTLNNIDILILKDANEASNYLNKLSDIMRFMLFETKTDTILLSKELEYINKYIALQKIRTVNSNYISFDVKGSPQGKTIAPMVFLPFIENAFKHTGNKKLEHAITINIDIKQESLTFECANKFNPNRKLKQGNNGLGNSLIEKRLKLIYPKKHLLKVANEDGLYRVNLTINL
ncbi:sensor histidine kinase [Costertonia aggregata]|uniref:Histidine kinase n=1 Tax=Costertonia aggregata TaxID=343403 RepID=A0A7H9AM63_9FLAO|nr:sensor histidine kinase [Costertonia aggregata]QLG44375.1 histidine kinase [Costertonia aggregata]